MDDIKLKITQNKYKLPYHWIRDPLHKYSLPYFGYMDIVLNNLPKLPAKILDAGCGDGRISAEITHRGYKVTGIDYLEALVAYAKIMVPEGSFFQGDLRNDLYSTYDICDQFDAVVLVEVYEHIPPENCCVVLANLRKVLVDNGKLLISVPSKLHPQSKLHYRHFSQNELITEVEEAGFRIHNIIYQHRMDWFSSFLLNDRIEKFLNNHWLQPIFLKKLRKNLYMKYANMAKNEYTCGRYIAVAIKTN